MMLVGKFKDAEVILIISGKGEIKIYVIVTGGFVSD